MAVPAGPLRVRQLDGDTRRREVLRRGLIPGFSAVQAEQQLYVIDLGIVLGWAKLCDLGLQGCFQPGGIPIRFFDAVRVATKCSLNTFSLQFKLRPGLFRITTSAVTTAVS